MSFNSLLITPDANLVALYRCQDNAANTVVTDDGPNGDNGVMNGGNTSSKTTTGPNSWLPAAFDLDGTGDYVSGLTDAAFNISGNVAVGGFFIPDSSTATAILFGASLTSSPFTGYALGVNSGTPRFYTDNGGWSDWSSAALTNSQWHHFTGSNNNSSTYLYLNGTQQTVGSKSNPSSYTGSKAFGANRLGGSEFAGRLSLIYVFNRHLSLAEHNDLRLGPEPRYSSGVSFADNGSFNVGTWGLLSPYSGGSNGTITYEWAVANLAGSTIDSGTGSTGTADLSSEAGNTVYLLVRASNDGGYDIGDSATRISGFMGGDDGYYEIASVVAAAGGSTIPALDQHMLRGGLLALCGGLN